MIASYLNSTRRLAFILAIVVGTVATGSAWSHSAFTSFTRIDWNKNDNSIELIMQMHSHELEDQLSLIAGKRLSFLIDGDYTDLEDAAALLLANHLTLKLDDEKIVPEFIGLELQGQTVYLYLEKTLPAAPGRISFLNTLFFTEQPGQINSVMAVVDGERQAGELSPGSPAIVMDF